MKLLAQSTLITGNIIIGKIAVSYRLSLIKYTNCNRDNREIEKDKRQKLPDPASPLSRLCDGRPFHPTRQGVSAMAFGFLYYRQRKQMQTILWWCRALGYFFTSRASNHHSDLVMLDKEDHRSFKVLPTRTTLLNNLRPPTRDLHLSRLRYNYSKLSILSSSPTTPGAVPSSLSLYTHRILPTAAILSR